jgi:uncharacterized protein YndB with AHSA1/START domain
MALKRDGSIRRWVEMELVLPVSAEQAWHAVATGPGLSAWFTPTWIEERPGGRLRFDFGDGVEGPGTVTAWEPPYRFAYEERDWDEGAPPVATECLLTPRGEHACVFRMSHAVWTPEDRWDAALESFEAGWPAFFAVLRLYLAHHAGEPTALVHAATMPAGDAREAWSKLLAGLGLASAQVGDRCTVPPGVPALAGTVERITQDHRSRDMLLRLKTPCPGAALLGSYTMNGQTRCSIHLYLYGAQAASTAAAEQRRWNAWLRERLPDAGTNAPAVQEAR